MSRALTRRRDQIDAALAQLGVPNLLHHEVASEPARSLHNDRANAVMLDPFEHRSKTWAGIDGIGTAHGCIVKLADQLVPGAAGERLDRLTLPPIAVLVGSNVGPQTRSAGKK